MTSSFSWKCYPIQLHTHTLRLLWGHTAHTLRLLWSHQYLLILMGPTPSCACNKYSVSLKQVLKQINLGRNFNVLISAILSHQRDENFLLYPHIGYNNIQIRLASVGGHFRPTLFGLDKINDPSDGTLTLMIIFKKWANPGLFYHLFSVFSNKHHYNFNNNYMWKNYIQYKVLGFKPTTFGTWASCHNH